jgi:glycosyltransferase involved in cell wall biosynthesis
MSHKILFLAQFPPPIHGAAVVNEAVYDILSKNYSVTKLNLSNAKSTSDIGKLGFRKIWAIILMFISIVTQLTKSDIQYVYISFCPWGASFYRDSIISLIAKLFGKKLIFHIHGQGLKKSSTVKYLLCKFIFRTSKVIHLSNKFYDEVAPFIDKNNFYVIPNSVPDSHLFTKSSSDIIQVLFLSNFMAGKGVEKVLEIAESLFKLNSKYKLKFIISGATMDFQVNNYIEKWARENTNLLDCNFVEIYGPSYDHAKHELFRNSDIFLFPSVIDTYPLVLIEAMSHGLAIVTSNSGAIDEMVENDKNAFVVKDERVEPYITAIKNLLENPNLLNSFQNKSRELYLERYTPELFRHNVIKVFNKLVQ